jgi:phage anti-repressor protein
MLSVSETLVKYDYAELTHNQLADVMGFSEEEKTMLNIFWEPTFNSGWIYLSDEMIKEQMTNEKSACAIPNFYNRVLISDDYEENIDYKKITKDHDLVKSYENFYYSKLNNRNSSNRKKYYAITGDTYKDLLQKSANKKGKQTRKYYRKIEQLAIFMKDYINAMHKHLMEVQLAEQEAKINRIHRINEEYLSYKKLNEKNETIYIVSTYNYASQGVYKIGRTKNMKSRSSSHNTTHVAGDKVKVLKEFKVNDSQLIEKNIHKKLNGLLVKGDKEFFMCPYNLLEDLLDVIVNDDTNHNNLVNSIIDTVNGLRTTNYDSNAWTTGIDMSIFTEEIILVVQNDDREDNVQARFDTTLATEQQKQDFVAKCVDVYKQTIQDPQTLVWVNFTKFLFSQVNLSKKKYLAREWKPRFNQVMEIP